ncbi:MAG: porin family protein [Lentisphaerae bacterium]|nr:porin family protein [Lentisphaerota bacterium]
MKKLLAVAVGVLAFGGICNAGGLFFGAHGAYTVGGDVEEESFGYGAQIGVVGEHLGLELSGTLIEDEDPATAGGATEFEVGSVALTLLLGANISGGCRAYVGGGVNYNRFTFDSKADLDYDDDDQVGFHACAGLAFTIVDVLQAFVEYRHTMVQYDTEAFDADDIMAGVDFIKLDDDYTFGMVRAGLNLVL